MTDAFRRDVRAVTRVKRLHMADWQRVRALQARYDCILTPTVTV